MRKVCWLVLLVLSVSLVEGKIFSRARVLCKIKDSRLNEVSGIAVSPKHPRVIWVHNDSGDGPYLYAVNPKGKKIATLEITNGRALDWEDMAWGKYKGKSCLFAADIGDNYLIRSSVRIYIVAEPDPKKFAKSPHLKVKALKVLKLTYPDGPHNAEALVIDPKGNLYIFEKATSRFAWMYSASHKEMEKKNSITLKKAYRFDLKKIAGRRSKRGYQITGGDLSPKGKKLVLRGYRWASEMTWPLAKKLSGHRISIPRQPQGEAICYAGKASILLTTSEKSHQPIYILKRKKDGH